MLEIKNLTAAVDEKEVLKEVSLKVEDNQTVVLFGPNGSGKTALFKVIMGLSEYKVIQGEIIFNGKKINDLSIDQRHRLGLSIMFQQPPTVNGVSLKKLVKQSNRNLTDVDETAEKINVNQFLEKGINAGLSGGEQKRSELFQLMVNPEAQLYFLDEPDSGVDLENLELVGSVIKKLVEGKSGLIITHTGDILEFVSADKAYVMIDGQIVCSGQPDVIFNQIKKEGYSECFNCQKEGPDE